MGIKFTNFATSTLASGILAGATSLSVFAGDGAKFPVLGAGDYFYAVLENLAGAREVIKVTARTGDSFSTIVRAQDGTSALAWNAGDKIELRLVNLSLVELTASEIHDATNKATPVDADELGIADSAASYGLKKLLWSNLKATLKTYFDPIYMALVAPGASGNLLTSNGSAWVSQAHVVASSPVTTLVTGSNTPDTFVDCGVSITLPVGTWDIEYNGCLHMGQNATAGQLLGLLALRTTAASDATFVAGSYACGVMTNAASDTRLGTAYGRMTITVAAPTTYYVGVTSKVNSGTPAPAALYADGRYGAINLIARLRSL